jgi:general secretion pathway protein K
MSATPASFPRKRESSVSSLQRRWVPAFAGTTTSAGARPCLHGRQRGVALIMVLWLTVLLTVIGGAFAFSMRSEALASRNTVSLAQTRSAADGAVERATFELARPRTTESWKADGTQRRWQDSDIALAVTARDEASKIDVNGAAEPLLKSVFVNLAELSDVDANAIVDAIVDWRDADDLRRPNGAEAPDYRAANSNYTPANRPFETVGELSRVLGVTPAIYARVAGVLTVHSRQSGVNAQTAERDTLLALPGATTEMVDEYILRRDEALASGYPVPPFPPAQGFPAGAGPVWRIRAQATAADGVTFVREAVVRATADPRRPFYALLWSEGERPAVRPPAPAEAAAATPPSTSRPSDDARRS